MVYYDPWYTQSLSSGSEAYLDAALLTCSICEVLYSLESEIEYVWKGPRNVGQAFYLLARYICIISFIIFIPIDAPELNVLNHGYFYNVNGYTHWLFNLNLIFVELIFLRRTWALWDCTKKMAIILSVLSLSSWGATLGLILFGMLGAAVGDFAYLYFAPLTVFYIIIMILVIIRVHSMRSTYNTSFVRLVYTQGVAWYTVLSLLSASGLVIVILDSKKITTVSRIIQFLFTHMACRMTLSLKVQSARTDVDFGFKDHLQSQEQSGVPLSGLNFEHQRTSDFETLVSRSAMV